MLDHTTTGQRLMSPLVRMCGALFCRLQRQPPTSDEVGMRNNLTRTF